MASFCTLPAAPLHSHSRKLMQQQTPAPLRSSSVDEYVSTILAVIVCALIAAVALSTVVRCVLRIARWVRVEPPAPCCEAAAKVEREAALKASMSGLVMYSSEAAGSAGGGTECAICLQAEFAAGERVRVLPRCKHRFHAQCIDRWLELRLSCPTCRRCVVDDDVSRTESAGPGRRVDEA